MPNFFLPSMKLVQKGREGSRWARRHDAPQTAYQRLLAHGDLQPKARRALRDPSAALDPFVLAAEVERRLKPILGAALAASGASPPLRRHRKPRRKAATRDNAATQR